MRKLFTLKNILILSILLGGIFITNCTSDQNMTGYTDSQNLPLAKINDTEISYEVLSLDAAENEPIEIQVAPSVLNLENNGVVVTVHTNIPYSQVIAANVELNEIEIQSWKTDSQGFFVAKFDIVEVKKLVELEIGSEEELTLTLIGDLTTGGGFSVSEVIFVIDRTGK